MVPGHVFAYTALCSGIRYLSYPKHLPHAVRPQPGAGSRDAADRLIALLNEIDPEGAELAARSLNLQPVAGDTRRDVDQLGQNPVASVSNPPRTRAIRSPAAGASPKDPYRIAARLRELRATDALEAVATLTVRAAAEARLDDPYQLAGLLAAFRETGASEAVRVLLARDPAASVSLDDPYRVAGLLRELRAAGALDAVAALAPAQPPTPASVTPVVSLLCFRSCAEPPNLMLPRYSLIDPPHMPPWILRGESRAS